MAVGVKPTLPGYKPDDSVSWLYRHIYYITFTFFLQLLSTTWLDHAVWVLYDHIFRSAAFGLTTFRFSLSFFCLRLLPPTCFFDRFLGDHLCFLEVRVLTTFLTIVRSGLHGNSSTREHENVRFGWQNSTKKHYLALEKHKNRSWGKVELCPFSGVKET